MSNYDKEDNCGVCPQLIQYMALAILGEAVHSKQDVQCLFSQSTLQPLLASALACGASSTGSLQE